MKKQKAKFVPKHQATAQKNNPVIQDNLSNKTALGILLGLLGILTLFVFYDFIFLNKVFLYKDIASDSINIGLPQLFHIADYIQNMGGIPRWTFYQGMGQNYLGYLTADPFDILLYFTPASNIVYMLGFMEILKFLTAGIFFYLFLREIKLTPFTAIVGAVCYAFCGFSMLGSAWRIFSSELYQAAFLLFATEKLLNKKWYYFPFAIALFGVTVTFNLFIYSVVTAVYVLVRLLCRQTNCKTIVQTYGKIIGWGTLGIGMSAFILYHKALLMLDSPRVSGSSSFFSELMSTGIFHTDKLIDNLTKTGRLFSNDMLGSGSFFAGAENYLEAPLFYVGLLSLLLFTQFFPFLSKQKKWIFGLVFFCALLPFVFPFFRYALWLFSGRYYRGLSFLFGLVLLVYAMLSLNHLDVTRKINYKVLFATLGVILVLLFMPNLVGENDLFNSDLQIICTVFLLLYTLLISLFPVGKSVRYIKPVLIVLVFIELAFMANSTVNQRTYIYGYYQDGTPVYKDAIISYEETKRKEGFNDYSVDAVQYVKRIDHSFYRIQKTYGSGPAIHGSLNDPLMQRFYGTTSYIGFNQSNYVKFLLATVIPEGSNEWATRWLNGLSADFPLLQIFGNVHYNLSKEPLPANSLLTLLNDSINKIGDVYVYKHKFILPFGYTYSDYILRSAFDKLSFKDNVFLEAVVIDDSKEKNFARVLNKFEQIIEPAQYSIEELSNDVNNRSQETLRLTHFSQNNIKGEITLSGNKLLFFTIPFDKNWRVYDNGKERSLELVNIGFSGLLLDSGTHTIELRFEPAGFYPSMIVSLLSLLITLFMILKFHLYRKAK